MIRFIRRLILLAVAVVIIALMVANRHTVSVALDPFASEVPAAAIEAPMFVVLFAALLAGFVLGGIGAWTSQAKWRELARKRTKETHRLRKDRERLASDLHSAQQTGASTDARLPAR